MAQQPLLKSLVLWPTDAGLEPRILRFTRRKVNYLWSPARTGKSCLWPIIDFVLGATLPRFPKGPVSSAVDWYELDFCMDSSLSQMQVMARGHPRKPRLMHGVRRIEDSPKLPQSNTTFKRYMEPQNAGLDMLPNTPFGPISCRDLVLLNHLAQYVLGDPHSFIVDSIKSHSKMKVGYLLECLFGLPESRAVLYARYADRQRSRQQSLRQASEYFIPEYDRLARLAAQVGVLGCSPDSLAGQPHEIILRELEIAARRLSLKRIRDTKLDLRYGADIGHATYDLGVLAGRIAELLRLSGVALDQIKQQDAVTNEEFGTLEKTLETSSVVGLTQLISNEMQRCIDLMGLDRLPGRIGIDPASMGLYVEKNFGQRAPLTEIGGQQNYVGYNIAALIAIHIAFRKANLTVLNPILVIDQPSQAYFEAGGMPQTAHISKDSRERLQRLYWALDEMVATCEETPMIIVIERSPPEDLLSMKNSCAVEGWCGESDGLLPKAWL